MFKLLKLFAWVLFTVILLVAVDQLLVRVPIALPGVTQAQTFYVDFRNRLIGLLGVEQISQRPVKSIEQVIEANKVAPPKQKSSARRYLYVDDAGGLQFADSLSQVPLRYRESAQPLAE